MDDCRLIIQKHDKQKTSIWAVPYKNRMLHYYAFLRTKRSHAVSIWLWNVCLNCQHVSFQKKSDRAAQNVLTCSKYLHRKINTYITQVSHSLLCLNSVSVCSVFSGSLKACLYWPWLSECLSPCVDKGIKVYELRDVTGEIQW